MPNKQYPWQNPLVKLLIELDQQCETSKEIFSEKHFHLLFDQLTEKYQIDLTFASYIKNRIIDGAKNSAKRKPVTHFENLSPIIKKIFFLYVENTHEATLKFTFLSSLSGWIKNKQKLDQAVLERGAISSPLSGKKVGLFTGKIVCEQLPQYHRIVMSANPPTTIDDITPDTIVMHTRQTDNQLTAYWIKNDKIASMSFDIEDVKDIVDKLPAVDKALDNDEKLIKAIILQYHLYKDIDFTRTLINLVDYLNFIFEDIPLTLNNIVIESILFGAEADTSRNLTTIIESMTDQVILLHDRHLDENIHQDIENYGNYILNNRDFFAKICSIICIEALQEVCNKDIHLDFNINDLSINQDFIQQLGQIKNQYAPFKNAPLFDMTYVFQAENQRLKKLLDELDSTTNTKLKMAKQIDIVNVGREIHASLHELNNTPCTGVNTRSITKDLIAINQAIANPTEQKNINHLKQRAIVHKNSADKRKALGIMMLTLGISLTVLGSIVIAGTLGIGLPGGIALVVSGLGITETGISFFDRGYKKGKMAEGEEKIANDLLPIPRHRPYH